MELQKSRSQEQDLEIALELSRKQTKAIRATNSQALSKPPRMASVLLYRIAEPLLRAAWRR